MCKANAMVTLLQGCNGMRRLQKIHAQAVITGLQHHPAVSSKLLYFCAVSVSGCLSYAQLLFHQMQNPQAQDWNSIIRGFAYSPSPIQAILLYNFMVSASPSRPDTYTFSFVLKACGRVKAKSKCEEVHGFIIRSGYETDVISCTNLIRSYVENGSIDTARKIFDNMSNRDLVSWNSMISCCTQAGLHNEALSMYHQMTKLQVDLDGFTIVTLLSSCAHIGALNFGIGIHKLACEKGLIRSVYVGNALIDMYAKCGCLDEALMVFDGMCRRDVFTWNSMIVGYGTHGCGEEAISFFQRMLKAGVPPNSITFLGLLCGCSHQGLVKEGVGYFDMMSSTFKLQPGIKHYGCLVDLFGRSGKIEKALEIVRTYSQKDPVLWRSLLGSCKIHKNVEIGEIALKNLLQLGAANAGDCMLLAAIYGGAADAEGVARMRKLIKRLGIRTTPGWSWIEVGDKLHRFAANDKSHPDSIQIYQMLGAVIHHATLYCRAAMSLITPHLLSTRDGFLNICSTP